MKTILFFKHVHIISTSCNSITNMTSSISCTKIYGKWWWWWWQVVSSTCKPGVAVPLSNLYVAVFLLVTWTLIFVPLLQIMNIAQGNNFAFLSFCLCLMNHHGWYSDCDVGWTTKELWLNSWQGW